MWGEYDEVEEGRILQEMNEAWEEYEKGYDEDDYDEDEYYEIDNTDLSYTGRNICIKLNDNLNERRNKLATSEEVLCKKFKKIKEIDSEERLQEIVDNVFREGFNKQMYIRNLTFTNKNTGYDVLILAIRPERYPGDYLDRILPEGVSLLFKGHIRGKEFIIDSIYETADTEKLDFEVDCIATPYKNPERIEGGNFLYDLKDEADSLTEYTGEKLEEWKEYLKWKKELANRQIFGCKYYKITFDEKKKRIVFWLVCENKEYFQSFRKYLNRDIQVFDNDYSSDKWRFKFASNTRKKRYSSIDIGNFKGVVNEYYLNEIETDKNDKENDSLSDLKEFQDSDYYEDLYYDDDFEAENIDNDDEFETGNIESRLNKEFKNPYIVQVSFELSRSDLDEINRRNLEDNEFIDYVYDNVLGNYYSNGFLALSAIGEFVLINRFEQAIKQLEMDECYSPNLAMWLFNVEKARISQDKEVKVDNWLNKNIEKNENQKKAVYKMLEAPDLCLIQGPPGTGKTTVIAEAIYQFVKNGNRVLIASQSNDAVDNALERLADTPEIRAIRLGNKRRRKRKTEDSDSRKFSEDEALKYYYNALSMQISRNWLDKWSGMEEIDRQYDKDIRDARLYVQDVTELSDSYRRKNNVLDMQRKIISDLKRKLNEANENNINLQNEKQQYNIFKNNICGESEESFYLSENQLRIIETGLNPIINNAKNMGIYLAPGLLDINIMGASNENKYIALLIKAIILIEGLKEKILMASENSCDNIPENALLQYKYDEVKQNMTNAFLEGDLELANELKRELNKISVKIDKLKYKSSIVSITDSEKHILSKDLQTIILNGNNKEVLSVISNIQEMWKISIEKVQNAINLYLNKKHIINTSELTEQIKISEGKYYNTKTECENIRQEIEHKKLTLASLSQKYEIPNASEQEIIEHIERIKSENREKLREHAQFRSEWESTLQSFKERLEDKESFEYDQENYQDIYINACNVVGISCTDNMRNLTDNGYDDFDVVIIDEVSKATPPELLIPLMKARKAILVGDHRQLPPMFKEHEGTYKELTQNQDNIPEELRELLTEDNFKRFKNMVTSSLFKDYFENADESIKHSLLVQYRMHSDIMDIINRFYEQRLSNGLTSEQEEKAKNHGLTIKGVDGSSFIEKSGHAYWIDSSVLPSGTPIYETFINKSTSACNIHEKYIIIELLKKISDEYKKQGYSKQNRKTVGVISFYQKQVNEIRDAFRDAKRKYDFSSIEVDINTVDRFQGKEKHIIITSLVRNNKAAKASKHVVAFERINVAFSRAQELLFIVGAKHMYENSKVELPNMDIKGFKTVPVYKNIMDDLNRKGCFKFSGQIITPELEEDILREYRENGGRV